MVNVVSGRRTMNTPKTYNKVVRNTYRIFFMAVFSVLFLFLPLTSVHAAEKKINGVVRKAPGVGWPNGFWMIEDKRIKVTEQTEFKGDKSKAGFGAKIIAKGQVVDGVFTAIEIEVKTDDLLYATK
jgi:hypothetical protein